MSEELAILGGAPIIEDPLPPYRSMGKAESDAVTRVMQSDCLSGFYGSPGPEFMGGEEVRALEDEWCREYGTRNALSVNSATSGLIAAMGALGLSPGDEVIVPPTTMSATVMAPLIYGGIPVFADIEPKTFCIDPANVAESITSRTKGIVAVNLFGHPARLAELRTIADDHGLWLVEDSAQAPLSEENGHRSGTLGDIGIYSLNYHKHIHCGEGGVCVTASDALAERLALIRNHGENCVAEAGVNDLTNLIGFNFRMTELSAAVARVQLARLDEHVSCRRRAAIALSQGVSNLAGIFPPDARDGCSHDYYCWTLRIDAGALGIDRDTFSRALAAEGFPNTAGYVEPLYLLPLFHDRMAMGRNGYPFNLTERRYGRGLCPVAERLQENEILFFEPCAYALDDELLARLIEALIKVHRNAERLAQELTWRIE